MLPQHLSNEDRANEQSSNYGAFRDTAIRFHNIVASVPLSWLACESLLPGDFNSSKYAAKISNGQKCAAKIYPPKPNQNRKLCFRTWRVI